MGIDKSYENVTVDIEDNYYFAGADAVQTSQTRSSYDYELPLVFEPLVKKILRVEQLRLRPIWVKPCLKSTIPVKNCQFLSFMKLRPPAINYILYSVC